MTTMMDWEETSPGGSASGSSLNGHSEAEEEVVSGGRIINHITTLNLKLNCNYIATATTSSSSDKKPNQYNYFPSSAIKENSLLLNDGFNGLNLNPSPPAPVGQNLSTTTTTTSTFHHHSSSRTATTSSSSGSKQSYLSVLGPSGAGSSQNSSPSTSSTNGVKTSSSGKKNKPIPPPLDLSIGASSLNSSSSSSSSSTGSGTFQYPGTFYSPYYHLGSPKFSQAEKSLPLRKRWHSWSPKLMNCNEDLIPLYADPPMAGSNIGPSVSVLRGGDSNCAEGLSGQNSTLYGTKSNSTLQPPSSYSMLRGGGQGPSGIGNATPQSAGLQTPTPFYTPNEPSPRFMNSPVFTYAPLDTKLYQGPYSPNRTSTLYPPGSPYLNSSLNTPTFVITNLSPPSAPTTSVTTVGIGASSSGSNSSASSSSSTATGATPSIPTVLTTSNGFSSAFPTTLLSPASSQASSTQSSYEEPHDSKSFVLPGTPAWNIFMAGTKIRFINDIGHMTPWYLVDHLSLTDLSVFVGFKGDYAPNGLSVKQYVVTSSARERVQITFTPANNEQLQIHHPNIEADCEAGHPFMVMKKGVCAVKPERFAEAYGSHCMKLEMLDVCVSLSSGGAAKQVHHPSASGFMSGNGICTTLPSSLRNGHGGNGTTSNSMMGRLPPPLSHIFHSQSMEDVKPSLSDLKHTFSETLKPAYAEDMKLFPHSVPVSVIPTSNHSPQPHHIELHHHTKPENFRMETEPSPSSANSLSLGGKKTKTKSKCKKNKESNNNLVSSTPGLNAQGEPKGRRPMNAFLVYAKERRPLLIQMYPGKDNRSISTLLGDSWKNLNPEEKSYYIKTAKDSADEQKKLHPDCWKRKRSQQPAPNGPPMKMEVLTKVS